MNENVFWNFDQVLIYGFVFFSLICKRQSSSSSSSKTIAFFTRSFYLCKGDIFSFFLFPYLSLYHLLFCHWFFGFPIHVSISLSLSSDFCLSFVSIILKVKKKFIIISLSWTRIITGICVSLCVCVQIFRTAKNKNRLNQNQTNSNICLAFYFEKQTEPMITFSQFALLPPPPPPLFKYD